MMKKHHKTKNDWLSWFKLFEDQGEEFWPNYLSSYNIRTKKGIYQAKHFFRKKHRNFLRFGEGIIELMTGKTSHTRMSKKKIEKPIDWSKWTRKELEEVARRYYEITKEKKKIVKDNEAKSLSLTLTKKALILFISRSGLYYQRKTPTTKSDLHIEHKIIEFMGKTASLTH